MMGSVVTWQSLKSPGRQASGRVFGELSRLHQLWWEDWPTLLASGPGWYPGLCKWKRELYSTISSLLILCSWLWISSFKCLLLGFSHHDGLYCELEQTLSLLNCFLKNIPQLEKELRCYPRILWTVWVRDLGIRYIGPREAYLDIECMSQEREFPQDPATEALALPA